MTLGEIASRTDTGRKRRHNEDAYVCAPPIFAVADGVGGAQAGELASRLAAAALDTDYESLADGSGEQRVASLIQEANRRVYQRASEDDSASGMGTTMTVALAEDGRVVIGHVGDSRAYLVRDGALEQLTDDHSLVAELVRDGKISQEEAEIHPQRSVITRVLGTEPNVDVDSFTVEAREGDVFLLATDGLTSMVGDETIRDIVGRHRGDLETAARELVRAANQGGGDDNITVVCFEIAAAEAARETSETLTLPLVQEPADDEEDTLTGLEPLPPLTAEPRRQGAAPRRRRRGARLLSAFLLTALLVAACVAALFGLSRSHFVGAEPDGQVAVYQGVPYDLVGPVKLYRAVYVSPLLAVQLTPEERRSLFDHDLRGHDSALERLKRFEREVVR